jgi:hypothetical protein
MQKHRYRELYLAFAWSAILATLLLGGCSYSIKVRVLHSPDGTLEFTLRKDRPLGGPADVNGFSVFEYGNNDWDYKHPVWTFQLQAGTYLKIGNLRYGVLPQGFTENTKAQPLLKGKKYLAVAFGAGSGGSTEFTMPQ